MKFSKLLLILVMMTVAVMPTFAVTDKEMDEARAIAAKLYLRWTNNLSGYLDDFDVKSMSDLESKLKATEKDNIQVFKSIAVPGDYASWDKDKLVEYWSDTFFKSPKLNADGVRARPYIKKKLQAMNVSAPSQPEAAAHTSAEPVTLTDDPANATPEPTQAAPTEQLTANDLQTEAQNDILADQQAMEEDALRAEENMPEQKSNTWVYVLVLAVLVGIVIWLVVYAANVMKRQPREDNDNEERRPESDTADLRAQAKAALEKKNQELKELHARLQNEENRSANLGMELERLKLENSRLHQQVIKLREEKMSNNPAPTRNRPLSPAEAVVAATGESLHRKEGESGKKDNFLKVIYLGRANQRGIFIRADRRITSGNTIYRLDTNDGLVGSFHVVDEPEVVDLALSDPKLYLGSGCTGEELDDTSGVTRIVTESDGTAIFENGYWKILRKTRIRYE